MMMALREQRPDGNTGALTETFAIGRAGYHEASAMRADAVPDMGNVFNAMSGGSREQALFMITQEEAKAEMSGGSSINIAQAGASGADTMRKDREKRRDADTRLQMQLALLNALDNRIAELDSEMDALDAQMRAKYGDDYLDKFYATHVGEPLEGMSEEEKLDGLAEVMLDENGDVRAEFAGNDMAEYLEKRDDRMDAVAAREEYDRTGDISVVQTVAREQGFSAAAEFAQSYDQNLQTVFDEEQDRRIRDGIENNQNAASINTSLNSFSL